MKRNDPRKKKKRQQWPVLKKSLRDFLVDEEGKMTARDITKIGLALAILSTLPVSQSFGQHTNVFHTGSSDGSGYGGHTSHSSHSSHSSHGSHGSHGNY
jgi:hypothetical protein